MRNLTIGAIIGVTLSMYDPIIAIGAVAVAAIIGLSFTSTKAKKANVKEAVNA